MGQDGCSQGRRAGVGGKFWIVRVEPVRGPGPGWSTVSWSLCRPSASSSPRRGAARCPRAPAAAPGGARPRAPPRRSCRTGPPSPSVLHTTMASAASCSRRSEKLPLCTAPFRATQRGRTPRPHEASAQAQLDHSGRFPGCWRRQQRRGGRGHVAGRTPRRRAGAAVGEVRPRAMPSSTRGRRSTGRCPCRRRRASPRASCRANRPR